MRAARPSVLTGTPVPTGPLRFPWRGGAVVGGPGENGRWAQRGPNPASRLRSLLSVTPRGSVLWVSMKLLSVLQLAGAACWSCGHCLGELS